MKIGGFSCDKCNSPYYHEPMNISILPEGWFALTQGSNLLQQDKHFCSLECLTLWVNNVARKVDAIRSDPNFFDTSQKPDKSIGDLVKARPRLET